MKYILTLMPLPPARVLCLLLLAFTASACTEPALRIEPVAPTIAYVGESARIPLVVRNTTGDDVTLSWSGPAIPLLRRWVTLVPMPTDGELQWDPQLEHVGAHRITVRARAGDAAAERALDVEVVRARQATPVFLDPPAAVAVDVLQTPCITLPVRVRDNDSEAVDVRLIAGAPPSASLTTSDGGAHVFHWCPSPDELATRAVWRLTFEATDDRHAPRTHETRLLLVQPERADCPGDPPQVVSFSPEDGARVVSEVGYEVRMVVQSERPLADAPVLFFTDGRLETRDRLDVATLQATPFFAGQRAGEWVARVPTFRLAEDETKTITTLVWLSDDADPNGTRCDRRASLRARSFVAVGAVEAGVLPLCAPCTQSGDCRSNVCLATATGGRCVAACPDESCASGTCGLDASPEGVVREGCGPAALVCDGRLACSPTDAIDAELRPDGARPTLCGQSEATFVWQAPSEGLVSFDAEVATLRHPGDGTAPIELQVRDASDALLGGQRGERATVRACARAGERLLLHLSSPAAADVDARIDARHTPGTCACAEAPPSGLLADGEQQGTLCDGRTRYAELVLGPHTRLIARLQSETLDADLDLEIRDPSGQRVARSAGSSSTEWAQVDSIEGGTYSLSIGDARRAPLANWTLDLQRAPLATCGDTRDCDAGELCDAGRCRHVACARTADCPDDAVCSALTGATRTCVPPCERDGDCPSGQACKATLDGQACGTVGSAQTGDACDAASDCAGERMCLAWPDGYCAAAGCDAGIACPAGDVCGVVDGRAVCLQSCWISDLACGRDAPYACHEVYDTSGEVNFACVPEAR